MERTRSEAFGPLILIERAMSVCVRGSGGGRVKNAFNLNLSAIKTIDTIIFCSFDLFSLGGGRQILKGLIPKITYKTYSTLHLLSRYSAVVQHLYLVIVSAAYETGSYNRQCP